MKSSTIVFDFIAAALLVSSVSATPGTFSLNIAKKRSPYASIRKRSDGTLDVTLINPPKHNLYAVNISIGTPPQPLTLQIDTGSSDLWVQTPNSQLCQSEGSPCAFSGTFDPSQSKTYKVAIENGFQSIYGDGTGANGSYAKDTLLMGGVSIPDFQFGVALEATSNEAVFGIAFDTQEFAETPYPNIVDALMSQKIIDSATYSLWLNTPDASEGSLIFGGVDTSKYTGDLITMPILHNQGKSPTRFYVPVTGLSVSGDGQTQDLTDSTTFPFAVVLDSGSTQTILPDALFNEFVQITGAVYNNDLQTYLIDCDVDKSAYFSYQFGGSNGPIIKVPASNIVNPLINDDGSQVTANGGTPVCQFGVSGAGDSQDANAIAILGDTFLRSAYIVFDLGNSEISMAQASTDQNSSPNVLVIPSAGVGAASVTAGSASATAPVASGATIRITTNGATATAATITGSATGGHFTIGGNSATKSSPAGAATTTAKSSANVLTSSLVGSALVGFVTLVALYL